MNRLQRRQNKRKEKGSPPGDSPSAPGQVFSEALKHQQAGRLAEAEALYRQVLAVDGRHADSLHQLGIIAYRQKQYDVAADLIGQAIQAKDDVPGYHNSLGATLRSQGKLAEAVGQYERALALKPDYAEGLSNLGNVLAQMGRLDEAEARFERALAVNPAYAEANYNLALVLERQGRSDEARRRYERAQALRPAYADTVFNQASALQRGGKTREAAMLYERALALDPRHVDASNNLGVALQAMGRLDEAATQYRRAVTLDPACASAHGNWASVLQRQGRFVEAIATARKALALADTRETRQVLAECIRHADPSRMTDADMRDLVRRALCEAWGPLPEMSVAAMRIIKRTPEIVRYFGQASLSLVELGHLAGDPLVLALLRGAPVADPELERLLTACRATLLAEVRRNPTSGAFDGAILDLACALAEQCFANEYVFGCSVDEARLVGELETLILEGLGQGRPGEPVPLSWLVSLATYRPLVSLPGVERLVDQAWPGPAGRLLDSQIRQPLEERRDRTGIESLTPIRNEVSARVREQYEQNPYPRWLTVPAATPARSLEALIAGNYPRAVLRAMGARRPDILIAGCGTGQLSISTAQVFPTADILAVDLSRASLAYARRKTRELALHNIRYAQADLLELRTLGRAFDLVDASGVLHHLGDPLAGLDVLVSLLRSDGLMKIGLYSEMARRPIAEIRKHIAAQGYVASPEDIRRCRQDILALPNGDMRRQVVSVPDFYSLSECRDLLFPAQEHCLTIPVIEGWLERFDLTFLAFHVGPDIEQAFDRCFPDPSARADLARWHLFEQENPNVFLGMYRFWVQGKPS